MAEKTAYEGWAIVELMGHRRLAGAVSEAVQYGVPMLRLDVPGKADEPPIATQFYGGAALYCVTPTTEEIARAVAQTSQPAPVQRWELAPPKPRHDPGPYPDRDEWAEMHDDEPDEPEVGRP